MRERERIRDYTKPRVLCVTEYALYKLTFTYLLTYISS